MYEKIQKIQSIFNDFSYLSIGVLLIFKLFLSDKIIKAKTLEIDSLLLRKITLENWKKTFFIDANEQTVDIHRHKRLKRRVITAETTNESIYRNGCFLSIHFLFIYFYVL